MNYSKSYLVIFIILNFLFSCNKTIESKAIYSYNRYDKNDSVRGYFKRKVHYKNNNTLRKDSIFRFDKNMVLENIRVEEYQLDKEIVKSLNGEFLFSIKKEDSCYSYLNSDNDTYEACYLGKANVVINNKVYSGVYKFLIEQKILDGVSTYYYFDDDFILIRQELNEGNLNYYRIDRVN